MKPNAAKVQALARPESEMYASERQDNFRWLSKLVGSYADCEPLKSNMLAPEDIKKRVDKIGQYSELIYSYVPVKELFENHHLLKEEGILPEYQALFCDCSFIRYIEGEKTNLSAFVVYRRSVGQLIVSISGSTRFKHMKYNLHAIHTPWPGAPLPAPSDHSLVETGAGAPTVHSGFLKLYQDIAKDLTETLQAEFRNQSPQELIITGHSMGGSVSYLLCMELLEKHSETLPAKVCLATYGAPRTGNTALVQHYRTLVEAFKSKEGSTFEEYSIKAYNDGVPAVPPQAFGYAHFSDQPMYAFQRRLYQVPAGNKESSLFHVETTDIPSEAAASGSQTDTQTNRFSKGGHNYYNGRNLEGFRRITNRLDAAGFPGSEKWREKFRKSVKSQEVTTQ